jgi:tRNA(fMet)-specific endonuclease VapC
LGTLVDSSVIVAIERGVVLGERLIDEPLLIAAITASELLQGVHAADETRRGRREAFVEGVLARAQVLPFDMVVARVHARLRFGLARKGLSIGALDLMIGATALAHGLAVATHNLREFERIPGLDLVRL